MSGSAYFTYKVSPDSDTKGAKHIESGVPLHQGEIIRCDIYSYRIESIAHDDFLNRIEREEEVAREARTTPIITLKKIKT